MTRAPSDLLGPGDVIGSYRVRALLEEPEEDYQQLLAEHVLIGRTVALKVATDADPQAMWATRLEQAARIMARLDHPNVVRVFEVEVRDGRLLVATEYVEGTGSLEDALRQGQTPPPMVVLRMLADLGDALDRAHREGLVHKDVKPANMLIKANGAAVLRGFELAVLAGSPDPFVDRHMVVGTPPYMAPEQISQTRAAPAADIWAMGIALHTLLTGRLPWRSSDWESDPEPLFSEILSNEPVGLDALNGVVPGYVQEIVRKCLARDPAERYASAKALRLALLSAADHMETAGTEMVSVPPVSGRTILLHVEHREASRQGQFRQYAIGALLGSGTFGDVYRAVDEATGQALALKLLKSEWLGEAEAVARFRREAELLARLHHAHIVRVLNFGRYGRSHFIAMELLPGRTLAGVLAAGGPLLPERAAVLLAPVLDGLSEVHARGIIHRDIKPSNLGLDGDRAVLFDFGIAAWDEGEPLTRTGDMLGTPLYMSPEQARGERLTPASDVYSMGVILYKALTGHLPHDCGESFYSQLHAVAREAPDPVTRWRTDLPPEMVNCIEGMMRAEPEERLTAGEASRGLANLVG